MVRLFLFLMVFFLASCGDLSLGGERRQAHDGWSDDGAGGCKISVTVSPEDFVVVPATDSLLKSLPAQARLSQPFTIAVLYEENTVKNAAEVEKPKPSSLRFYKDTTDITALFCDFRAGGLPISQTRYDMYPDGFDKKVNVGVFKQKFWLCNPHTPLPDTITAVLEFGNQKMRKNLHIQTR